MSTPAQTTISAMKAQAAPTDVANLPQVSVGFNTLQSFELAQRGAKLLAASSLVPQAYQGNIPNCVIALNMASRMGADPLMVMQNLYVVHGNPGWSSKFLIACVNTSGRFSALRYEWRGVKGADDYGCRAWAVEKSTNERLNGVWVDWAMVKAEGWDKRNGSKWKTMPDQMFVYRAAAFWTRGYAPELSMGLQTTEEIHDVFDAKQNGAGRFEVDLDDLRPGAMTAATPASEGFDVTAALVAIAAAPTVPALNELMKQLDAQTEAAGIDFPVELEGAEKDRRAALDQKL